MPKNIILIIILYLSTYGLGLAQSETLREGSPNPLLYAVAWKQTAAEYRALFHQGFNVARFHLAEAIATHKPENKPLAVITDVDDTILLSTPYWGYLVTEGKDFFDDNAWDSWIRNNSTVASPGALEFLRYCYANDVEVFYVTNRDQGPDTFSLALNNLSTAGFPYADSEHLSVLRESSNKEAIQARLRDEYQVVLSLGDNLNDFARKYYVADVDERIERMTDDRELYGMQYVLFPNPTDGHWIRAIFGESEPAPTDENRLKFKEAAVSTSWQSP